MIWAQGTPFNRKPHVPPAVERLGNMLSKAELMELVWWLWVRYCQGTFPWMLASLVQRVNRSRKERDPLNAPLDASRMKGDGSTELRRACDDALGDLG